MKILKNTFCHMILFQFLCLILSGSNVSHAANIENWRWSFDFKNCTISDALSQITKVSGINIVPNKAIEKRI